MRLAAVMALVFLFAFPSYAKRPNWETVRCSLELALKSGDTELPHSFYEHLLREVVEGGVSRPFDAVRGFQQFGSDLIVWTSHESLDRRGLTVDVLFKVSLETGKATWFFADNFITAFKVEGPHSTFPGRLFIARLDPAGGTRGRPGRGVNVPAGKEDITEYPVRQGGKVTIDRGESLYLRSNTAWAFDNLPRILPGNAIVDFEVRLGKVFVRRASDPANAEMTEVKTPQ